MPQIKHIRAMEVLDSRGQPTVAVTIELRSRAKATALVPAGASTGRHEAQELRDGGKRYGGLGVTKAVKNVNTDIFELLQRRTIKDQIDLDYELCAFDGTKNKGRLGANAILGVSLAFARACAYEADLPLYRYLQRGYGFPRNSQLPLPMMNILNGGRHADNGLSIQEFMIVPKFSSFARRLQAGAEIYHKLKQILKQRRLATGLGDEGGFAPRLTDGEQAMKLLVQAIGKAGYRPGREIGLAIDVAASEFYNGSSYVYDRKKLSATKLIGLYQRWLKKYPLFSIEDGLAEDDWDDWRRLTATLGDKVMLVGDDLFVTNYDRLQQGIERAVANAVLVKLNQIGTVSETMSTIKLAQKHSYTIIISHRSGETPDDFIADLAVASGAEYIKAGAPARSERLAKYNRLLNIERQIMS